MTREELKSHCETEIARCEFWSNNDDEKVENSKIYQEHKLVLELLQQETCEDAVSREAVLEKINNIGVKGFVDYNSYSEMFDFVDTLPPVTPKQRTGKWIITSFTDRYICSECGHDLITQYKPDNYCSYCGAKMIFDRTDDIISCEEI